MIKTYRMWRYLRVIEKELFREPIKDPIKGNETTSVEINTEFCKLKTIYGRHYKANDGIKAAIMAAKLGYTAKSKGKILPDGSYIVGINGEGLKYTSFSNLVNELVGIVGNLPQFLTLVVSIIAIVVSIVALHHHQ
jgi:hypothetical protein